MVTQELIKDFSKLNQIENYNFRELLDKYDDPLFELI